MERWAGIWQRVGPPVCGGVGLLGTSAPLSWAHLSGPQPQSPAAQAPNSDAGPAWPFFTVLSFPLCPDLGSSRSEEEAANA